ncbi:hypothetical protein MLD38_038529 [Melastoma candidum]|uniref:Uncharacterized protein n=1 Tax=Melastoma candidum TaxID=119954 RepID=A0ACB9L0E4_9MYRT|nr:hypothetical protein MLD38_038529 [Melastoma candidum]
MRAKSHYHSSSCEENFINVLLKMQESAKTGALSISLNDNTLKDIVMDMLIAGSDTWPTSVEWAMSELLKNPHIMKKAQTEMRDALTGKDAVEESDLEDFQYLKQIIKETFRLHTPAALLARVPEEDCVVHGHDIPKGSRVLINTWTMGRDPNNWENPEKFQPERNLDSTIDLVGNHFEILPYGSGKRACAGAGFAVANIELMLANLIYCFDWEVANGLGPEGLDMAEAPGMIIRRKNPLLIVATPHHTTA